MLHSVLEVPLAAVHFQIAKFCKLIGLDETTAAICGISISLISLAAVMFPVHHVKTKMLNMQPDLEGNYPYSSYSDCAFKILKEEGLSAFYTGFLIQCARIVHRVLIMFIILKMLWKQSV